MATHPLDPLTPNEIAKTLRVLKSAGKITQNSLLPYVVLKEPPKNEVQGFQSGEEFRREAFVEIYQRDTGKLFESTVNFFESTVNLRKSVVADNHEVSRALERGIGPPYGSHDDRARVCGSASLHSPARQRVLPCLADD